MIFKMTNAYYKKRQGRNDHFSDEQAHARSLMGGKAKAASAGTLAPMESQPRRLFGTPRI